MKIKSLMGREKDENLAMIGDAPNKEPFRLICWEFARPTCLLHPFGRLVYTMLPYIIEPEQLSLITSAIYKIISALQWATERGALVTSHVLDHTRPFMPPIMGRC